MDNDELVAGLSLHLGMPVSSPMKLHHDGDSFLRSVSKESYGRGRRGPRPVVSGTELGPDRCGPNSGDFGDLDPGVLESGEFSRTCSYASPSPEGTDGAERSRGLGH